MTNILIVLNYFFGILFLCLGLVLLPKNAMGGLILIVISLVLFPPVRKYASKLRKK